MRRQCNTIASAPSNKTSAMDIMYQAVALAESKDNIILTQKTCRTCQITKIVSNYTIKNKSGELNLDCNQCIITRNAIQPRRAPIGHYRCSDCKQIMPLSNFGVGYNNSRDVRCIGCRADYNKRYRMPILGQTPKKRSRVDDYLEKIDQDIRSTQSSIDKIIQEHASVPTTAQATTLPHVNCVQVNAEVATSEIAAPRGLEKFDDVELIIAIVKVFQFNSIVDLKCIYPNETISDLNLWRSQVRELYAAQNPGMDDDYRRVMFDYAQAARDLKNKAAGRTATSA